MTKKELDEYLTSRFTLDKWPSQFDVDAETYANVIQDTFDFFDVPYNSQNKSVYIGIGPNNGFIYKRTELILMRKK